jgi:hypothetical protein
MKMEKRLILIFVIAIGLVTFGCDSQESADFSPGTGKGGSMARFTIIGNFLYTVDNSSLRTVNITDPANMEVTAETNVGFGIETIYPYGGYLFIGSMEGMYIYSVENPDNPTYISAFFHLTACDPVVVQGDYAYVTLRDGWDCRQGVNQLEVVNVANIFQPFLEKTINLTHPHGLGIEGNQLFVTEGQNGLRQFDVSDPTNPQQIRMIDSLKSFDVITNNGLLMVVGSEGLYQYQFNQDGDLTFLSSILKEEE